MRATGKIESLSYSALYVTGAVVALFLSLSQHTPMEKLVLHTACSWGYVLYWVWHY